MEFGILIPTSICIDHFMGIGFGVYRIWIWEVGDLKSDIFILWGCIWSNTTTSNPIFNYFALDSVVFGTQIR